MGNFWTRRIELWENVAYGALNRCFTVGALEEQLHTFLTVALYGGECQLHALVTVPWGRTHWYLMNRGVGGL